MPHAESRDFLETTMPMTLSDNRWDNQYGYVECSHNEEDRKTIQIVAETRKY